MEDKIIETSFIGNIDNSVSVEYSLNKCNDEQLYAAALAILRLISGEKLPPQKREIYEVNSLIGKSEYLSHSKPLRNFNKYENGTAIMIPKDVNSIDAEYFGFWAKSLTKSF
jgi:hypothetical protein